MASDAVPRTPPRRPFAVPRGSLGRIAGRWMAQANEPAQYEVAAHLDVGHGDEVVEVGYGPGRLVRRLLDTTGAECVAGVDPSGAMLVQAGRTAQPYVREGRVDLRLGVAAQLPWPAGAFTHAVAVNAVETWPDVPAGLAEMHRVLADGGTALVAWHSPSSPRRSQRALAMTDRRVDELGEQMADVFGDARADDLGHVVALVARR
jgi:ubiquinone/menaquinone biosynthesis C-methylase UbiE